MTAPSLAIKPQRVMSTICGAFVGFESGGMPTDCRAMWVVVLYVGLILLQPTREGIEGL